MGRLLGSVGVIAGALAIRFTGWQWVDPLVAVGIGLWVLPRTWILLRDTANVLLEGAPAGLSVAKVREALANVDGVEDVHDLHVWSMSAADATCTVHLRISGRDEDAIRTAAAAVLQQSFGIDHVTIQTERTAHDAPSAIHR